MSQTDDHRAQIDRLRRFPQELEQEIAGLQDDALDFQPAPREWSIRQIVHHLADSHMNAFIRTKLLLLEDNPTVKPYDQDAWAETADYRGPVATSLDILAGLHARWAALFEAADDTALARRGQHPESGEITVGGLLSTYVEHGLIHIRQIRANLRAREHATGGR